MIIQQVKTEQLTKRELQILWQLAGGRLNKEISTELDISLDTVKKHVKNIYRKINARNRVEAVHFALLLKSKPEIITINTANLTREANKLPTVSKQEPVAKKQPKVWSIC